ncbi:carbohydrate kinase family protein [Candidatus Pyrohabitans sp.]
MDVVGVGALNLDKIYRVPRIAKPGEEVFVIEAMQSAGGSAANTIVGLARLGVSTGFIGAVGKDSDGDFLIAELQREGVDTSAIARLDAPTGIIIALVDDKGERSMYAYPGANDLLKLSEESIAYASQARYLHFSSFVGDYGLEVQRALMVKLEKQKLSFAPGMLYAKERCLVELKEFISASEVIFLNRDEAFHLTGNEYRRGAEMLLHMGAKRVVVTLGEDGCFVACGEEKLHIPGIKTKVVDTTGAGDAFAAGFLYGMIKGYGLKTCGNLGNFVAARCISRMGARAGLPTRQEVEEFLEGL